MVLIPTVTTIVATVSQFVLLHIIPLQIHSLDFVYKYVLLATMQIMILEHVLYLLHVVEHWWETLSPLHAFNLKNALSVILSI